MIKFSLIQLNLLTINLEMERFISYPDTCLKFSFRRIRNADFA